MGRRGTRRSLLGPIGPLLPRPRVSWLACVSASWLACASAPQAEPAIVMPRGQATAPDRQTTVQAPTAASASISVPATLSTVSLPRRVVARGLKNPRGMYPLPEGGLLVSEAGTGAPDSPNSGALLRMRDENQDGDFDDPGERVVLLPDQPSKNIFHIVRRDEVFGMAAIAGGEGTVLAALAFFGGPSTIFQVRGDTVSQWGSTHGNVNDLVYDPSDKHWYAVASTTDEVIRLLEGGRAERVLKFPTMPSGQDAVPGYVEYDPSSGKLLVSLFTGSPEGEEGGDGTELVPRAGGIVEVDPQTQATRWLVSGLTVPTDFAIAPDGTLYVLEFCDDFVDPVNTREDMAKGPMHGGFRRFSGRLLKIDRTTGAVTVVATGLDEPTNIALAGSTLYIAEGMGTPGRQIPGPNGPQALDGFISAVDLSAP